MNSAAPSSSSSDGTVQACSPWSWSRSLLVTSSLGPSRLAEARDVGRDLRQQMLGVVDQQQRPLRGERVDERLLERDPGRSRTSSALATASSASAGSRSAASETHQTPSGASSATSAAACNASRVFPVPPGPGERQQPDVVAAQQADDLVQLARAAEERRRRNGQVRLVERLQAREVARRRAGRARSGAERSFSRCSPRSRRSSPATRSRVACDSEHLPAVPGRGDPRRAMDVDPDVALVGDDRLARVEPHADADRPVVERRLAVGGGGERVRCARERDEERVALRVHLDAAVPRERLAQDAPVLGQQVRVPVAVLVQQPRRAFDVREEERDGA